MSAALIGIDTNIVARLILRDHEVQYKKCLKLLEQTRSGGPLMLNPMVIAELAWLLERRFDQPRAEARKLVGKIASSAEMLVPQSISTGNLFECLKSNHGEFFDVMIAQTNLASGCDFTYTFDRKAAREVPGMELLT